MRGIPRLPLERFEERGLLAADVGAVAVDEVPLHRVVERPEGARLVDRRHQRAS